MPKGILIVDDDVHINDMLKTLLTRNGYAVSQAFSGTEAVLAVANRRPDLILLDLMLPGLRGEEVLPRLRGIPVIVLSAKADSDSKVKLLLDGAVDYVTKPFDSKELLARITVALRSSPVGTVLTCGSVRLDMDRFRVTVKDEEVRLTRTEFAILKTLMLHARQVVTKSALLERISPDTPDCTESSLKIHISNLRRKLREDCIESVWGIGFKMREN